MVALLVALGVDFEWGAIFAIGALLGTLNWYLLAVLLIAITTKSTRSAVVMPVALVSKVALLFFSIFVVLPPVSHQVVAFLCGFTMFLLLAVFQAVGQLLLMLNRSGRSPEREASGLRTLAMDARTDA